MNDTVICPCCGGDAYAVESERDIRIGRAVARVVDSRMHCYDCEEEFYLPGQMNATQRRAIEQIRKREGLLAPTEIKAIRQKYGLTQEQFEQALRVGPKTVVRWERGTVAPARAVDTLLRVFDSDPDVFERWAETQGVRVRKTEDRTSASKWWLGRRDVYCRIEIPAPVVRGVSRIASRDLIEESRMTGEFELPSEFKIAG